MMQQLRLIFRQNNGKAQLLELVLQKEDVLYLKSKSSFFNELTKDVQEIEATIELEEENIRDAVKLILQVTSRFKKKESDIIPWSAYLAKLGSKWIITEYVDQHSLYMKQHLEKVLNYLKEEYLVIRWPRTSKEQRIPVVRSIFATPIAHFFVNDLMAKAVEYKVTYKSDTCWTISLVKSGIEHWIRTDETGKDLVYKTDKTITTCSNVSVKIERTDPTKDDIDLFWKMMPVVINYDAYKIDMPITNSNQLVDFLSKYKIMWRKKAMSQILTSEEIITLCLSQENNVN